MWTKFDAGEGRTLSYVRRGSGPLLVCVPGGPGMDPLAYFAAMDLPGYELLILAPRGTGASSPPADLDGYRISGYVQDVEDLRVHLGAERLTLYGNSHGGCVALAYACRFPDRVERFILANAPARMDHEYEAMATAAQTRFAERRPDGAARLAAAELAAAALEGELEPAQWRRQYRTLMARNVAHEGPAECAYLDRLCAAPMNYESVGPMYDEFLGGLDLLGEASRAAAPALVIAGELDVIVPAAAMRRLAAALPAGRYLEVPGVGHHVEVEAEAAFRRAVCGFLAG